VSGTSPNGSRARTAGGRLLARPLALLAGVALLVVGCAGETKPVVVGVARAEAITTTAAGPGIFEPAVDVPVVLGFRGTVTTVEVGLGQRVVAGEPLVAVSSAGLDNVAGKLGARASALTASVTALQKGGASAGVIAAAQAQATLAQNALAVANAGRGQIRAPISGVVADITSTPGGRVLSDEPLLHIVQTEQLTVTAQLASVFMGRVRTGMPALVRVSGTSGVALAGIVTRVAPVASTNGQTFTVVVLVATPGGAQPGTNAYVSVPLTVDAPVAVNHLAVLNADTFPTVFVVEGSTVQQRRVALGLSDGETTQIVSGVSSGDSVVIAGSQQLSDGSVVTVRKGGG